jgi:hypothetical protein
MINFDQACPSGNIMVDAWDREPVVAPECSDCDCTPCRCDEIRDAAVSMREDVVCVKS